ncbi:HET-domain-containing protein, partial [Ophiobolus disseminans]
MRHARTDQTDLEYTCLSYVWGTANATQRIMVNGKPFQVQQNLWEFLHAASIHTEACLRTLWIDALCIDQDNIIERNHQVQQMGSIYSRAKNVIAWIGNDTDIVLLFQLVHDSIRGDSVPFDRDPRLLIEKLENHVYWKRAWITQELLLARSLDFLAREVLVSMNSIREKSIGQVGIVPALYDSLGRLLRNIRNDRGLAPKLIDTIDIFSHKVCADPRDMAYSLIPVSLDGSKLQVDYDCSLSELARNILR